jgi:type II secretory pathway pseudopilin PulG
MTKIASHKKGFTLVEVLISLSVLIMVVVSATGLLVSSIRTNADNIDVIIAYGLAQEGLEAVRNIRDSNWLLGADYKKGGVINGSSIWGDTLPTVSGKNYYTLEYQNPVSNGGLFGNADGGEAITSGDAPWRLNLLDTSIINQAGCPNDTLEHLYSCSSKTLLYKKKSLNRDVYSYTLAGGGAIATQYHRFISIEIVDHKMPNDSTGNAALSNKTYLVTSRTAYGNNREVALTTELTDWKEI